MWLISEIYQLLRQILTNQEKQMSGLTDLQAAVTANGVALQSLVTEQAQFLTDITAALANADADAAVEAASVLVAQQTQTLQGLVTAQASADPVTTPPVVVAQPPAS